MTQWREWHDNIVEQTAQQLLGEIIEWLESSGTEPRLWIARQIAEKWGYERKD